MEKEKKEERAWTLWVNWEKRVISFQEAAGFEKLNFPSHEEKFAFAIEKGSSGFAIQ